MRAPGADVGHPRPRRQGRDHPPQGGPGKRSNDGTGRYPANTNGPPIADLAETWRRTDHCPPPTVSASGVILVTIADAGHQWPGQPGPTGSAVSALNLDPPSMALDATATISRFFAEHPRKTG